MLLYFLFILSLLEKYPSLSEIKFSNFRETTPPDLSTEDLYFTDELLMAAAEQCEASALIKKRHINIDFPDDLSEDDLVNAAINCENSVNK